MRKSNSYYFFCLTTLSFIAIFSFNVRAVVIDEEVEKELENNKEVSVIVVLEDDYDALDDYYSASELNDADDFEKEKMMIKEQQEKVLNELNYINTKQNDSKTNTVSEASEIGNALNETEFELKNKFTTINGFSGEVTEEGLEKLRNNPNVKRIDINYPNSISLSDTISIVNATKTWKIIQNSSNITGKGETICVIDSGIDYTHPDLGGCTTSEFIAGNCSKVIGGYDIKNDDNDPIDDNGHGTNVAGIIAANGSIVGIAPGAKLVAIKTQGSDGLGSQDGLISGIEWCTNNASKFNISVISMSLGCTSATYAIHCDSLPLCNNGELSIAIGAAIRKNISVIASSGNDGSKTFISSPACIANVTAVGSTDKDDTISSFSNRNAITDLFAPGRSITTTAKEGGSTSPTGTSFSAPHVSAAFALIRQFKLLESNLILTPAKIQDVLNTTGKILNDSEGTGLLFSRINVFAAIFSLDAAPKITFVPPTPTNKSGITDSSFFINLTSDKNLSVALLEFNQTNQTMNGSGTNWHKNVTGLDSGVFFYKVWGNDSLGKFNVSELRAIQINNTQPNIPEFFPSSIVIDIVEPNNQTFNITINDSDADILTIIWYRNGTLVSTSTEFNFTGNFSTFGFYNISVEISDGFLSDGKQWNLTVNNTNRIPSTVNISINSTDFLNRTNGTISAFWSFSDDDTDVFNTQSANETKWYNNSKEVAELFNYIIISSNYTQKNQNWTFSIRIFDGFNWSNWANSTILSIKNSNPVINITNAAISARETERINISLNAIDIDNDNLNYTINSTLFIPDNNFFIWATNLTSDGSYNFNITVNDSIDIDSIIVNLTILDARDLDNDGNPDFNESDDDNDGILDENDFLVGNLSSINTTLQLNIAINSTSNLSKLFNGTFIINITNGTDIIVEFNFTFNSSNILDFGNITINKTINGSSSVSIRGNLNLLGNKKTVYLEKINATAKSVCIKDADVGFELISSTCDSINEILVTCNNITNGQYTCYDTGARYRITGLNHSAVKEQCRDVDGDGYGTGCSLGSDCNDNDKSKTTDCSSGSSGSSGGGGSSSSGGGGGGGGGGGAFFVCNMDWKCSSWSECIDGKQIRNCEFVKAPQHASDSPCPSESAKPVTIQDCAEQKKEAEFVAWDNRTLNNKNDTATTKLSQQKINETSINNTIKNHPSKITGFAVNNVNINSFSNPFFVVVFLFLVLGISIFLYLRENKNF